MELIGFLCFIAAGLLGMSLPHIERRISNEARRRDRAQLAPWLPHILM